MATATVIVDRHARKRAHDLLLSFCRGDIDSDQFGNEWPRSLDPSIRAISRALYGLYSDLRPSKVKIDLRSEEWPANMIVRCLAFLKSDLEYEWPSSSMMALFGYPTHIDFLTLGISRIIHLVAKARTEKRSKATSGDCDAGAWPFFRHSDVREIFPPTARD